MEISLSNFTVAASSHSGEGGDKFVEKTKPLAELNDLGVHAKKHVGVGVSVREGVGADSVGVSVREGDGTGSVGVSVREGVGADSVGVSVREGVDAGSVGVFASEDVVQSTHYKVIAGYWLVKAVLDVALNRGANKNKLFRGTGIFEDALEPDSLISIKQYHLLLTNVQSQTKGADVSFLLGSALATQWLHSPMHVLQTCDTLEALLTHLVQQQTFRWCSIPFCQFQCFTTSHKVMLIPQLTVGGAKLAQFVSEVSFASIVALLKGIAKQRVSVSFNFTCARPKNIADFETHLGLKVAFNCPFNSMCIEKHALDEPMSTPVIHSPNMVTDKELGRYRLFERYPLISLPDYVRCHVYQTISAHNMGSALPELAEKLAISPATLKRKLKEFNTSYRQLSEEVWRNYALVLLSVHKANNEEAARQMGINDLPNFRRTVKRLTGKTPSELRLSNA